MLVGQQQLHQQPLGFQQLLGQQVSSQNLLQQHQVPQYLLGQQGGQFLGQTLPHLQTQHQQHYTPQAASNLIASLTNFGSNALPMYQNQAALTNLHQQVQQPLWGSLGVQQPFLGQTHPQPALGFQPLQQNIQLGNLLGQSAHPQAQQPYHHHGLLQPISLPQSQRQQASTQSGNSSMTGVMFVRPTEFAKFCQVEYAKKAKSDNCNLVLYVWGYVAQILAAKQGLASAMSEQEQLGRLQHIMHVLELCAMQSSITDFNSAAWLCARNYSDRVFQDLDSGATTWAHIGPKMHPTNMMQAMSAHPKVAITKPDKEKGFPVKPSDGSGPSTVCPKWLSCETEGKCQFEVDYPGRNCNRPHFCTFCFKKFKQTRKHKESDCRQKTEHSGASGDQPSS